MCRLLLKVETSFKIDIAIYCTRVEEAKWKLEFPLIPESLTRGLLSPAMRHVMNCCSSTKAFVLWEVNNSSMITECDHRDTL